MDTSRLTLKKTTQDTYTMYFDDKWIVKGIYPERIKFITKALYPILRKVIPNE